MIPQFSQGRILNFESGTVRGIGITQGITAENQQKYNNNPHFAGSNGTYATSFCSLGSYLHLIVSVYEDNNHAYKFNIRDYVLIFNQMQRISPQLVQYLIKQNVGKKVHLVNHESGWFLADINELDLNYRS